MISIPSTVSFVSIFSLLLCEIQGFAPLQMPQTVSSSSPTSSAPTMLYYQAKETVATPEPSVAVKTAPVQTTTHTKGKKASITNLKSLDDLKNLLEEDNRITVVKYYAPWCKSCQKLGLHFDKLARDIGDGIVNKQKVKGKVRFAKVEYCKSTTAGFITKQLKIRGVPDLQVYVGLSKVWEKAGQIDTRLLQKELDSLQADHTTEDSLIDYAKSVDDGILIDAIDEASYDKPSFLDEEW